MSKPPKPSITKRVGETDPFLSMGQRAYDLVTSQWPAISAFFLTGGGATVLALVTEWARALGPLGIGLIAFATACVGALSASSFQATMAKRRLRSLEAESYERWAQQVDEVNPLDKEFHKKRIDMSKFFNPITRMAKDKTFTDCELIGPCNLIFVASEDYKGIITGASFINCDIIVRRDGTPIWNVFGMVDTRIIGGSICNCTLIIDKGMVQAFDMQNAQFMTLTGDPAIDSRPPLGTAIGTQL